MFLKGNHTQVIYSLTYNSYPSLKSHLAFKIKFEDLWVLHDVALYFLFLSPVTYITWTQAFCCPAEQRLYVLVTHCFLSLPDLCSIQGSKHCETTFDYVILFKHCNDLVGRCHSCFRDEETEMWRGYVNCAKVIRLISGDLSAGLFGCKPHAYFQNTVPSLRISAFHVVKL